MSKGVKRYTIEVPEELSQEFERVAREQGTSSSEFLRKCVRLGLVVVSSDADIVFTKDGKEVRVKVIF